MRYTVRHRTFYQYGQKMSSGQSLGHLTPRSTPLQTVLSSTISVDPEPEERDQWLDTFGNPVSAFTITQPHDTLEVTATCEVEVSVPQLVPIEDPWEHVMARMSASFTTDDVQAQQF